MRFLVIRLSSIGDIVHALPAVAALGEAFPQAEITWAVETRYAVLLEGNPFVRRVLTLDTLGWRRRLASPRTWEEAWRGLASLRDAEYDAVLDFQGLVKSALLARWSGSARRLGLAEAHLREPPAALFYTERVAVPPGSHAIEEGLALVARLGVPVLRREQWRFPLPQPEADDRYVEAQLAKRGVRDFILVNPGGGWQSKRWPPDSYAQLVRLLRQGLGPERHWSILFTGSAVEEPLVRGILAQADDPRAGYFASTLTQFIALARRARLAVGGDTGPLHLAAAVGTPVVAIYGPTDPARNGPFAADDIALASGEPTDHTRRLRRPSYIQGVEAEAVREAIRRRVAKAYG